MFNKLERYINMFFSSSKDNTKSDKFSVCVFCGAHEGIKPEFKEAASKFGQLLAENDMRLVYGAGGKGLMGQVAYGVLNAGGEIYGITTDTIADFEEPIKDTKFKIVKTLQERKREFINSSDTFVCFPGGFGTYDELFEILVTCEIVNKHNNLVGKRDMDIPHPIILVNINNFFEGFKRLVESSIRAGFVSSTNKKYFKIVQSPAEAIDFIKKEIIGKKK